MNTVGFITKKGETSYFYSRVGDTVTVQSYTGSEGYVKQLMIELKASSMLILFEEFLQIDSRTIDRGKNVHVYDELIGRIRSFIDWGHKNRDIAPASIIDNAFISRKYMNAMIDMISPEHENIKDLIFLENCVTLTYHSPYNI